jgi:hypothetical protein
MTSRQIVGRVQNSRDILQDRGFMVAIVADTFQKRKYRLYEE